MFENINKIVIPNEKKIKLPIFKIFAKPHFMVVEILEDEVETIVSHYSNKNNYICKKNKNKKNKCIYCTRKDPKTNRYIICVNKYESEDKFIKGKIELSAGIFKSLRDIINQRKDEKFLVIVSGIGKGNKNIKNIYKSFWCHTFPPEGETFTEYQVRKLSDECLESLKILEQEEEIYYRESVKNFIIRNKTQSIKTLSLKLKMPEYEVLKIRNEGL